MIFDDAKADEYQREIKELVAHNILKLFIKSTFKS